MCFEHMGIIYNSCLFLSKYFYIMNRINNWEDTLMLIVKILFGIVMSLNVIIGLIAVGDAKAYGRYMSTVPAEDVEYHSFEDFPIWVYCVFPIGGLMYASYLMFVRVVNAIINR